MSRAQSSWISVGILVLFFLPALVYAGYSIADRWYQSYILGEEETLLRREIADLRERNLLLQSDLAHARRDEYIESVAREQLNLARPGDRSIVLVGPTAVAADRKPQSEPVPPPVPEPPSWRRIADQLVGR